MPEQAGETGKKVCDLLIHEGCSPEVAEDTHLDQLEINSLGVLNVLVGLEDEFNVIIGCNDWANINLVGDIVRLVDQKIKNRLPMAA